MSNMRITGLATGIDTESMIKKLMDAERVPLNNLLAKKQLLNWKHEAYRNVNSKLLEFRTLLDDLRLTNNFNKVKFTSSDEQYVKVSDGGNTQTGTHQIAVKSLASIGVAVGSQVNSSPSLTGSSLTADLQIDGTNNSFTMELGGIGKTITLDKGTYTLGSTGSLVSALQDKINQTFGAGKVSVQFDDAQQKLSFTPSGDTTQSGVQQYSPQLTLKTSSGSKLLTDLGFKEGQSYKVDELTTIEEMNSRLAAGFTFETDGSFSFTLNGIEIKGRKNDTVQSLLNKVNSSNAGVKMSFDEQSGQFSFATKTTGSNSTISFYKPGDAAGSATGDPNGFIKALGFDPNTQTTGTNAEFTIDGMTTQRNTNSFTLDGITYTLLKEMPAGNTVSVTTTQDNDAIFDKIKGFVDKYNDLIKDMHDRIGEKRYREFTPLTDEQKKEMKEKEIELWEDKAKSGLLRSDDFLTSITDKMRRSLMDPIAGVDGFNTLNAIGITTSKNYLDHGKLEIDEGKLRSAIADNLDQVVSLFTNKSSKPEEVGFAQRIYESVDEGIKSLSKKIGYGETLDRDITSLMGKEMDQLSNQIDTWEERMVKKEEAYYRQFSAMEQAMNRMNAQSSWLLSQFMGGSA